MVSMWIAILLVVAYLGTLVLGTSASYGALYDHLYGRQIGR